VRRARWAIAAIVGCAAVAAADPQTSREHYAAGKAAYTEGRFDVALAEFQRAFADAPATEYLQDIAQAYRHLGRCADSIAYFDRYLAASPDAPHRDAVVATVASLRTTCAKRAAPAASAHEPAGSAHEPAGSAHEPAASTREPSAEPRVAAAAAAPNVREPVAVQPSLRVADASAAPEATVQVSVAASAPASPGPWSITGDTSLIFLHAGPVVMPPVARVDAMARRRLDRAGMLHAAIGLTLAPIPYDDAMSGTAWLGGPIVALDGAWPLGPRVALVGEVAAGVQLAWGMGEGNPFTAGGHASSAIGLPYGRVGVGVSWRATDRVAIRVLPIAAEDAPRRGSLASDIPALRGFELRAGIAVDL